MSSDYVDSAGNTCLLFGRSLTRNRKSRRDYLAPEVAVLALRPLKNSHAKALPLVIVDKIQVDASVFLFRGGIFRPLPEYVCIHNPLQ